MHALFFQVRVTQIFFFTSEQKQKRQNPIIPPISMEVRDRNPYESMYYLFDVTNPRI